MPTILIAEDDPIQRRTVRRLVENEFAAEVIETSDGAEAMQQLQIAPIIDLVLVDLHMPVMDGWALLRQGLKLVPNRPFLILTGSESVDDAVKAMQLGAVDFISKPVEPGRLFASVRNSLTLRKLQLEVNQLKHGRASHFTFADIAALSPGLQELTALGKKAAASDIPVLITGESGVGKEVFAHAVHQESYRAGKPFISVNCGALPDNLVESTLFGHEKGSFTGATNKSLGKCREAQGGTLFLDEIGELKLDAQVKLLRLLQEGEIEPVGSSKPVQVNVRVISATNRPLRQMVEQGTFREDLYYRLHGLPLHIPPLRERRNDILLLAKRLLQRTASSSQRPLLHLSEEACAWVVNYPWPGNVRELQHMLSRAALLVENDKIEVKDLSSWSEGGSPVMTAKSQSTRAESIEQISLDHKNGQPKTLQEIEMEVIELTLLRYNSHIGKAAAMLGIGQSTLYKRMRRHE